MTEPIWKAGDFKDALFFKIVDEQLSSKAGFEVKKGV